jgi:hypothetical protein
MDDNHQFIQVSYQILRIQYQSDYQFNGLTQTVKKPDGRLFITSLITGSRLNNRPTSVTTNR